MDIVTVKNKFQIVIPAHVRKQAAIKVGDVLEATVEDGKVTFTPRTEFDRHLAQGLDDARNGRTHGPYATAREAIEALEARTGKTGNKRRK